jgi:ATP-dependent phosphoenolpyruvate carboxykinase
VADPYASREPGPPPDRPSPDSPFAPLIAARGGAAVATPAEAAALEGGAARFVAVTRTDLGLLPPLARLDPPLAVALLADGPGAERAVAARALAALRAVQAPVFLIKDGLVAGPEGRAGALEIDAELIEAALDAALDEGSGWERDPDFGYSVLTAPAGPGRLAGERADALCPRLLYAAADRVYEHAELVAEVKRGRRERLERVVGLDPAIVAASGWPVEPTSVSWKD